MINLVKKKKPERTCMACNEQKEKKELLRIVKSKDGVIEVLEIQAEGAKRMNAKDFLRGNQI